MSGCPRTRMIYNIFKTGRQSTRFVPCGRWTCVVCAEWKRIHIGEQLIDVSASDVVYTATLEKAWATAARKQAQKKGSDYMALSLQGGGLYLVSSQKLRGHKWKSAESTVTKSVIEINTWSGPTPTRISWSTHWRGDKRQRITDDSIVLRQVVPGGPVELAEILRSVGIDSSVLRLDGDSMQIAEVVEKAFHDYNSKPAVRIKRAKAGGWEEDLEGPRRS